MPTPGKKVWINAEKRYGKPQTAAIIQSFIILMIMEKIATNLLPPTACV